MVNLYCTSDHIGLATGGGVVTYFESKYLASLGPAVILGRGTLPDTDVKSPFVIDAMMYHKILEVQQQNNISKFDKALFYSGAFPATTKLLKAQGTKIAHTCAAHDPEISRQEHIAYTIKYDEAYPHLTDPAIRHLYTQGFRDVDLLICPSTHSAAVMKNFGCERIKVIPHGCYVPDKILPFPSKFTIGYLGQVGADKGLRYLLVAWNMLRRPEIEMKIRCSDPAFLSSINDRVGGYPADIGGRVPNPSDLFNHISVYVSASCTEGFGIPVLEAMAHGRPVICSRNTGAADLVKNGVNGFIVPTKDPYAIADCVLELQHHPEMLAQMGAAARETAAQHTWDKIGKQYIETLGNL